MEAFALRVARSDELQELVAIDDEASELFAKAGLKIEFEKDHPFVVAEQTRWATAIEQGLAHVAVTRQDMPIGFAALGYVDGELYLDQIAVRSHYMRRGIGAALLHNAITLSGGKPLWLTTYAHFPWNRPYYERHGFAMITEGECGAELYAILQDQRAALPDPDQRIVMVRRCSIMGA